MKALSDSSPQVAVIADDLTSAADGASPFRARGLSCEICQSQVKSTTTDIVAIDTKSRSLTSQEAVTVVSDAVTELRSCRILYKTIDSTLRGHIAAEMTAAFQASGRSRLVIAPAFPAAGRTTIDGIQLVAGRPLDQTIYRNDPVHPATVSRIADLVDKDIGSVACVPAPQQGEISGNLLAQSTVLILDALNQNDLNFSISQIPQREDILWVGSPGMANALAELYPHRNTASSRFSARRVLVVVGSANPVSRQQVDTMRETGINVASCAQDLSPGSTIACLVTPEARSDNPESILATLAREAAHAVHRFGFDAVIATGGDTMGMLLDKLSINRFKLLGEFEPGFPFGSTELPGCPDKSFLIGMKAGGFGNTSVLIDAARRILNQSDKHQGIAV